MNPDFELDARLAADTLPVLATEFLEVRLMDDSRWPWLLLIPRRPEIVEWTDLDPADARALHEASLATGRAMKATAPEHKLNVAALGNIVRQFHLHHVLRHPGDPAWPGPVWGHGERMRHGDAEGDRLARLWRDRLGDAIAP
jgi:diadenosine tetraphosphate (Ap4A) HIT family hydrolase